MTNFNSILSPSEVLVDVRRVWHLAAQALELEIGALKRRNAACRSSFCAACRQNEAHLQGLHVSVKLLKVLKKAPQHRQIQMIRREHGQESAST